MIARVQPFHTAGLGIAFGLLLVSYPTWSDVLKGTVNDPGAPSSNNGIAGVSLSVRDAKNTELAPGLTDGKGEYIVSFTGQTSAVKVVYEKPGFKPRPTVRWVVDTKSPQRPVLLIKEGAGNEYYKAAAAMLANEAGSVSAEDLQASAMAVAALSANDKAQVLQYLKSVPAVNVLAAIRTAEENDVVATRVKAAMFQEPSLKSAEINVELFNGVVQLSGFVRSRAVESKAVSVARKVEGVKSVKTDMVLR